MNEKKVVKAAERLHNAIKALNDIWPYGDDVGLQFLLRCPQQKKINKLAERVGNRGDKVVMAADALHELAVAEKG